MIFPSDVGGDRTREVGFIRAESNQVVDWIKSFLIGGYKVFDPEWTELEECLRDLDVRATTKVYAFVPIAEWTLVLTDGPLGTDFGDPNMFAEGCGATAIRAISVEKDAETTVLLPTHLLDISEPLASGKIRERYIFCGIDENDRWKFKTFGEPYPFEELEAYEGGRVAQRFDRRRLTKYLEAMRVPFDSEPIWARSRIVAKRWPTPKNQ